MPETPLGQRCMVDSADGGRACLAALPESGPGRANVAMLPRRRLRRRPEIRKPLPEAPLIALSPLKRPFELGRQVDQAFR